MNNNRDHKREELEKKQTKEYEKNAILNFSQSIGRAIIGHQTGCLTTLIALFIILLIFFLNK
ncbi:hypothetical protein [Paenibacillus sp. BR1-192]|uniref:hypothetical protein n=1 Tax=Paenibacillus sp. BR1-192 TaxID=3032287 RepID=UPI00240E7A84|nr:hypothetical protein [Paenibacillus sp. BR1-192]WFB59791.1 hypothetical protein P0X86_06030 [Paenibacillus sp. BR1-192]